MTVEAIKDKKKIEALLTYLKGKNERDWLLCKFQLNTGLRIGDVVSVKTKHVLTQNGNFMDYWIIKEQKTGKTKKIKLNEELRKALKSFVRTNNLHGDNYIFESRTKSSRVHISVTQAYRILKAAADAVGIQNFGTHSLRKTWGFFTYKESKYNIALIMSIFSHSSQSISLRYIGIDQESKDELYSLVQF